VTSCPDNSKEVQNVIVNAHGLVCLDEFQNARALATLLKSVTTGGAIRLRILYTTSGERVFEPDCAIFLTVNADAYMDEAGTKRLLSIDMGQCDAAAGGWRADHFVLKDWTDGRIRVRAWNELVCRLSAAMRLLSQAEKLGRADLSVQHRMSGFWGFVLSIAEQESPECLARMRAALTAVDSSQNVSLGSADDLLPKLLEWLKSFPEFCKTWMTATQISNELLHFWNGMGGPSVEMRKIVTSSFSLSKRLRSSQLYKTNLGLRLSESRKTKTFWFDPPTDGSQNDEETSKASNQTERQPIL